MFCYLDLNTMYCFERNGLTSARKPEVSGKSLVTSIRTLNCHTCKMGKEKNINSKKPTE